jgi:hypothetical protein
MMMGLLPANIRIIILLFLHNLLSVTAVSNLQLESAYFIPEKKFSHILCE